MALWAQLDTNDIIIDRFSRTINENTFNTKATSQVNLKPYLLPIVRVAFEPFDSATQIRTGPVDTITSTEVTETYIVSAKTAQELDDEKSATADSEIDIAINKAIATEVFIRDEELVSKINDIIQELSLITPEITALTADDWSTRIKTGYTGLL